MITLHRRWRLAVAGWLLVVLGGLLAHLVQTGSAVSVSDVRFEFADGKYLAALIYRPANATRSEPAPGVVAIHGYINSRETQSAFAIEFARRGYVVLAVDQTGHGFSDGVTGEAGLGGPAALRFLRSLPYVDPDRIGLEGHSMGGWAALQAAFELPDAYRSIVLVGSSTGPPLAPPANPDWPRNLGVVFSTYDEFAPLMWGVERGAQVVDSSKLKAVFGTAKSVVPGRVYGDMTNGTARWLATPAVTHPGDHLSTDAVAAALEWMGATVGAPRYLPADNQVWMWKELGTLVALIGSVFVLLGTFELLLALPAFAGLQARPVVAGVGPGAYLLLAAAALPALTYFPLIRLGTLFAANPVFPQAITNQVLVWALGNAALTLLAERFLPKAGGRPDGGGPRLLPTVVLAVVSVAAVYVGVTASGALAVSDMRFWVVALKPMAFHHLPTFVACLPLFLLFFVITQRATIDAFARPAAGATRQYLAVVSATAGGVAAMVGGLHLWLFAAGRLPPVDALFSIVAIQFVPVLTVTAIISVFTWRRTGSSLPGALVSALLVCWYVVAGQATQV